MIVGEVAAYLAVRPPLCVAWSVEARFPIIDLAS